MQVKRIVANLESQDLFQAKRFYQDILGLKVLMDLGWITTYGADTSMPVQISVMQHGGSGTATPDLSIELANAAQVEQAHDAMRQAGFVIAYGPVTEPWGVRRFYVCDPFGKLVNILSHLDT